MSRVLTISQEFLKVGGNLTFAPLVLSQVEHMFDKMRIAKTVSKSDLSDLEQCLLKHTNINFSLHLALGHPLQLGVYCVRFHGHSGAAGKYSQSPADISGTVFHEKLLRSTIDLEKAQVTGELSKVPFTMVVPTGLFSASWGLTPEEVTSLLLHEVGHAFYCLATLGEYVWLNYYLTDGIDVLLGKKPNKYRIELLNASYLQAKTTDPDLRKKLEADPTEENLRRAVLVSTLKEPRNHLTGQSVRGMNRRDEQLADMFVSRLGFTRPLASGLVKITRMGSSGRRFTRSREDFMAMEALKVLVATAGVLAAPWTAGVGLLLTLGVISTSVTEAHVHPFYDNPTERLQKLRNDLVSQLKSPEMSEQQRLALDEDIKTLDDILKNHNQYLSLWEVIGFALAPKARRDHQRLKHEEMLEQLLSNDLFVQAHRFRQLT